MIEIRSGDGPSYFHRGDWDSRAETPEQIAGRFLHYIDLLSAIHPLLALWMSGAKGPRKFEAIRDDFAKKRLLGETIMKNSNRSTATRALHIREASLTP